jgi:hypothetical protein
VQRVDEPSVEHELEKLVPPADPLQRVAEPSVEHELEKLVPPADPFSNRYLPI